MQREREEGEGGERGEKERERVSVCEREIESKRECERACVRETETAHVTEGGGGGVRAQGLDVSLGGESRVFENLWPRSIEDH